ncbi:RIP homotypic interaction motif-containing protein [Catellatospora sichuanensis]|uniref:RIP homotypic interaction motif-containing protein n=1 Tax=Catellatospora sichuanensis TaxID=1969805 RepID=UPI0011827EE6|nr:RIP homotypic interaction motif-containing protein [Catellatospora sichuanensis]
MYPTWNDEPPQVVLYISWLWTDTGHGHLLVERVVRHHGADDDDDASSSESRTVDFLISDLLNPNALALYGYQGFWLRLLSGSPLRYMDLPHRLRVGRNDELPAFGLAELLLVAASSPDTTRDPLADLHLTLHNVRGVQIGHRNLQVNRFILETRGAAISFDDLLRRPAIAWLIRALQTRPGDRGLRDQLVGALMRPGWTWTPAPLTLTVGDRYGPIVEFLRDLLTFDVRGVQISDDGEQHNRFVYGITGLPDGVSLLQGNGALAQLLVDVVCPPPGRDSAMAELIDLLCDELSELAIVWTDGRVHAVQYDVHDVSVLRVADAHGVQIVGGTQTTVVDVGLKAADIDLNADPFHPADTDFEIFETPIPPSAPGSHPLRTDLDDGLPPNRRLDGPDDHGHAGPSLHSGF